VAEWLDLISGMISLQVILELVHWRIWQAYGKFPKGCGGKLFAHAGTSQSMTGGVKGRSQPTRWTDMSTADICPRCTGHHVFAKAKPMLGNPSFGERQKA
jgi:hypothetical protein